MSTELMKGAVDTAAVDGGISRDLGRLFDQLAARWAGSERRQRQELAIASWQTSLQRWRNPKVPKEMWTRRDEQVRQIQADLARAEGLMTR